MAVICDYNYVFDPTVHLKRFFGEGAGGDYIFLIDEANNLAERGREMYSASICREDAVRVRKVMKERAPRLYRSLGKLDKQLKELQVDCGNYLVLPGTGSIIMTILKVQAKQTIFSILSINYIVLIYQFCNIQEITNIKIKLPYFIFQFHILMCFQKSIKFSLRFI